MGLDIDAAWRVWDRKERMAQLTHKIPVLKHCSKYCRWSSERWSFTPLWQIPVLATVGKRVKYLTWY